MTTAEASSAPAWGLPSPLPPPPPMPRRAEVVIVGGGITGVALLAELAAGGVEAVLLERGLVGSGATGRNAGFLLAGVAENYADAVRRHGRATAADVWRFTLENHALVAGSDAAAVAGHARRGSSTIAVDPDEAAALDESATLLAEDGFEVRSAQPPAGTLRMLVNPADGEVDPLALVRAMARPLGSRIHENAAAVSVEDGSNWATVGLAGDRSIEAHWVILATNAWTATLLPGVPIRPVRAQMLAGPGPGMTAPLARPAYADRGHRYWRRRADGMLLVGGFRHRALADEVGFDLSTTAAVQEPLERLFHDLGGAGAVTHRWCGTMGFSPDGLPLVGLPAKQRRVAVCAGYTGHGMGFAVNAARHLTAHLVESRPLPAWLKAAREVGASSV